MNIDKKVLSLKELHDIINYHFVPPFVAEDAVESYFCEENSEMCIRIGGREIFIDEDGEVCGSGTMF